MIDTKTLKPGDEVATYSYNYGDPRYQIFKVAKVSPTGQITLSTGSRFNTSGYLIGGMNDWSKTSIVSVTDEIREKADRQYLLSRIDAKVGKWATLPTDALRQIAEIIARHTGDAAHAE